jgi:hypothetical protein
VAHRARDGNFKSGRAGEICRVAASRDGAGASALVLVPSTTADDAGDVAPAVLLFFEEGIVVGIADRLVAAFDVDERIIALDLDFSRRSCNDVRLPCGTSLLALGLRLPVSDGVGRATDGADDRIAPEIIEAGTTGPVLAGPLGAACRFVGHGKPR